MQYVPVHEILVEQQLRMRAFSLGLYLSQTPSMEVEEDPVQILNL